MNASQAKIGFGRKIGYSFLGLMAGNGASLVALVLIALLSRLDAFAAIAHIGKMGIGEAAEMSLLFGIYSLPGWVALELPVVLLLRAEIGADFYWPIAAMIGGVLGVFALIPIYGMVYQDFTTLTNPADLRRIAPLFMFAVLIAGVAFVVYCCLVKAALRRQTKENGAPNGAPRSLPWFEV